LLSTQDHEHSRGSVEPFSKTVSKPGHTSLSKKKKKKKKKSSFFVDTLDRIKP